MKRIIIIICLIFSFITIFSLDFSASFAYNHYFVDEFWGLRKDIFNNENITYYDFRKYYDLSLHFEKKIKNLFSVYANIVFNSYKIIPWFGIEYPNINEYYLMQYFSLTRFGLKHNFKNIIFLKLQYTFRYFFDYKYFDNGFNGNSVFDYIDDIVCIDIIMKHIHFYTGIGVLHFNSFGISYIFTKSKFWDKVEVGFLFTGLSVTGEELNSLNYSIEKTKQTKFFSIFPAESPSSIEIPHGRLKFYMSYEFWHISLQIFNISDPYINNCKFGERKFSEHNGLTGFKLGVFI